MTTQINLRRVVVGALLLLAAILLVSPALASRTVWPASQPKHESRSANDLLLRLLSPSTVTAVVADKLLQQKFLDVVELTCDLTRQLALQFETVPELQQANEHIEKYRRKLGSNAFLKRRDLGDLLGLGGSSEANATATSLDGGILSGLTSSIGSALSGIGSSLIQDASSAGLFLGTGIGAGAAQGLNLAPAAMTMQVAAKIAADNGMNATGLDPIIQNAAMAATASLLGALNVSSLLSGAGGGGVDIHSVALGLAMGIGNGTSAGLKLSLQAEAIQPPASNATGDIAGTFGFGLTKSLASNIDISKLTSSAGSSLNISMITGGQPISQIALSLARGIGNGASSGLKLSQDKVAAPEGTSAADVAGAFGFGFTQSITQHINISNLASGSSAASGLTRNLNVGMIAQGAAMGLVQGAGDAVNSMGGLQALVNGTAKVSATSLPATTITFNDSVGGAATGFGQGLGGQGTLIGVQLLSQINFTSLLARLTGNKPSTGTEVATASLSNGTAVVKRHTFHPAEIFRRQTGSHIDGNASSLSLSLIINADSVSAVGQSAINALTCEGVGGLTLVALGLASSGTVEMNTISSVNSTFIKEAVPKGIIHFTSGGNIFQINGTVISNSDGSGLLRAADGVLINGNSVQKFSTLLATHILVSLLAFVNLVPAALSIEAARNLLVRLKLGHVLPNIPRWVNMIWIYVMSPLAILALIFGSLTGGNSGHFRTAHGVLGLITIIMTLGTSANQFFMKQSSNIALQQANIFPTAPFRFRDPLTIRTAINQALFVLILPTTVAGFADLSSTTLCVTRAIPLQTGIAFGMALSLPYTVASALSGLAIWLSAQEVRKRTKDEKKAMDEESWGKKSLKEKIRLVRKESNI